MKGAICSCGSGGHKEKGRPQNRWTDCAQEDLREKEFRRRDTELEINGKDLSGKATLFDTEKAQEE